MLTQWTTIIAATTPSASAWTAALGTPDSNLLVCLLWERTSHGRRSFVVLVPACSPCSAPPAIVAVGVLRGLGPGLEEPLCGSSLEARGFASGTSGDLCTTMTTAHWSAFFTSSELSGHIAIVTICAQPSFGRIHQFFIDYHLDPITPIETSRGSQYYVFKVQRHFRNTSSPITRLWCVRAFPR